MRGMDTRADEVSEATGTARSEVVEEEGDEAITEWLISVEKNCIVGFRSIWHHHVNSRIE